MDGEKGSTGQRMLKKAVNNNTRFQQNQVKILLKPLMMFKETH